jgi:hypothetical protein
MTEPKSFSLSLQKHFSDKHRELDYDFRRAFQHLNIASLLCRCGIFKEKGINTMTLLFWIILVPFFKKSMTSHWMCLFTHPKNARTPICARLINAHAAGNGDRKP